MPLVTRGNPFDCARPLSAALQVRAVTRAAFGCDSLIGFPLEDLPLGAGVHWEVRVFAIAERVYCASVFRSVSRTPSPSYRRGWLAPS